jgi:hypothetical protein
MTDDVGFLLWLILVIPFGDLAATVFFARLFWASHREPAPDSEPTYHTPLFSHPLVRWIGRPLRWLLEGRSWLLGLLSASFAVITLVFCWFGILVARRFIGLPTLGGTAGASTLMIVLLGVIPIVFAIAFWLTRRSSDRPPPFREGD